MHIVARAPNHLGDGVLALPALHALARVATTLTIQGPCFAADLYRDVPAKVIPPGLWQDGDAAVLFPPSLRVAWQARRVPRRVGVPSDFRRWLLTDPVVEGVHRFDTYAALVRILGAEVEHHPAYADGSPTDVPEGHVGFNPVSVSGAVVEWRGFLDLARRMARPVVFYGGPGERVETHGFDARLGLSLPAFASALRRCAVFVSNDSGAAHFARACGVPTVVVHGSTTAARTGPLGAIPVEGPELACRPCYRKTCRSAVPLACLNIPVEAVERAVEEALRRGGVASGTHAGIGVSG